MNFSLYCKENFSLIIKILSGIHSFFCFNVSVNYPVYNLDIAQEIFIIQLTSLGFFSVIMCQQTIHSLYYLDIAQEIIIIQLSKIQIQTYFEA